MKTHYPFDDPKLHVDQPQRKIVTRFNKPLFIYKSNKFNNQCDCNHPSKETRNNIWSCVGSQLDLSTVSFDLNGSVLELK